MYCNRLHAWWSTQSRLATLLSSLMTRQWVGLQTLWKFQLKDLSIDEMVGAWCFGCWSGPPGFTFWISFASVISFIYCWVLIFDLSPCFILIYMFKETISEGSFMQTNYLFVLIHFWIKSEVGAVYRFQPSSKIFYWPFQSSTSFVDILCFFLYCVFYAFVRVCLYVPCGHLLPSWLSFVVSYCEFVNFPLVSWVSRGTWLYWFLILAPLLTFTTRHVLHDSMRM